MKQRLVWCILILAFAPALAPLSLPAQVVPRPDRATPRPEAPAEQQPQQATPEQERVAAQQRADRAEAAALSRVIVDSFLVLVPVRDVRAIEADIERERTNESRAAAEKQLAERLERQARNELEVQKKEIDALKTRIKVAKDEGREVEKAALEEEKEAAEAARKILERRRDLRRKEIDSWSTAGEFARASRVAYENEAELAKLRAEFGQKREVTLSEARRYEARLNDLEKRTLEAQKKRAELRGKVASSERQIVQSRLQLLDARRKMMELK